MSTAKELIQEAKGAVAGMGDHLDAIEDFSGLTCLLFTVPDLEDECPGLHRLVHVIREHLFKTRIGTKGRLARSTDLRIHKTEARRFPAGGFRLSLNLYQRR
jgi:hypothetical protein